MSARPRRVLLEAPCELPREGFLRSLGMRRFLRVIRSLGLGRGPEFAECLELLDVLELLEFCKFFKFSNV